MMVGDVLGFSLAAGFLAAERPGGAHGVLAGMLLVVRLPEPRLAS